MEASEILGCSFSAPNRYSYQVFLSFRGKETRTAFTDHLYKALKREGFRIFRDNDEIERGEVIGMEIQQAIRESQISIIVISKDYAASRWCLDELVMIMERKRSCGHVVMPVFYHLDALQVREQSGSFAEAFSAHEERFKEEMDIVERWRTALRDASELSGFVLHDEFEPEFIKIIVEEVEHKLRRQQLNVPLHFVGRELSIRSIYSWVQDRSDDDVGIATICGIGGIGKTTIAKIVFNLNSTNFEGRSFLADVKEIWKQPNGMVRLQRQLLSDLLRRKAEKIYRIDEGVSRIKDVLRFRRVLVVLDDVDDLDQFHAIIQTHEWFFPGSKIIITTRNQSLLRSHGVNPVFRVEELNEDESLQLFSWHAFGQDHPADGFEEHSTKVVHYCGGLPLALKILGSSLYGKASDMWRDALGKLENFMDDRIQGILRVSYDSIQDDYDKDLFVDVACFFVGMDIDYVVTILGASYSYPRLGLQNLIDRCLLSTNRKNKLVMHQLIRDMGRSIDHKRSHDDPRRHSRLWNPEESLYILRENKGTESIRGLALQLPRSMQESCPSEDWKLCIEEKCACVGLYGKRSANRPPRNSLASTKALRKMQKLQFLHLSNVNLSGGYDNIPKSLTWLRWDGFSSNAIPAGLCQSKLVVLDMQYSNLKYCWKGTKYLWELKILKLSHSHGLVRTPNFKGLPNLEQLVLKDCVNLVKVHESISELGKLVLLNLKNCTSLESVPASISQIKSLKKVNLSGCMKLLKQQDVLEKTKSSGVLHADIPAVNPPSDSTLGCWQIPKRYARLSGFSLSFLPFSLVSLSVTGCNLSDSSIPTDLSSLCFLQNLDLSWNPICSLKERLGTLSTLKTLNLSCCQNLQSIPSLPSGLQELWLLKCKSLERIGNYLRAPTSVVEVEGWFKLEPIRNTSKEILDGLGLFNMESLQGIEVELGNFWSNFWSYKTRKTIQVLHEYGISSAFRPGNEVPKWFRDRYSNGTSAAFTVPPAKNSRIAGISLCVVYALDVGESHNILCVEIRNKTKRLRWPYRPRFYGIPETKDEQYMLWSSLWMFQEDMFEEGDMIEVSMACSRGLIVKEIGIRFIPEQEDQIHDRVRLYVPNETKPVRPDPWNETEIVRGDPWSNVWQLLPQVLFYASESEKIFFLSEFNKLDDSMDTLKKSGFWESYFLYGRAQNMSGSVLKRFNDLTSLIGSRIPDDQKNIEVEFRHYLLACRRFRLFA